jgi:hypothetical protein
VDGHGSRDFLQLGGLWQLPNAAREAKYQVRRDRSFRSSLQWRLNDLQDLWYQPVPKDAFDRLEADWVKFYMEVNPKKVKFHD